MIYSHRHSLAHFGMLAQDGIVEVEVEGLKVSGIGVPRKGIGAQLLICRCFGDIQKPGGVDSTSLQVFENSVLAGHNTEHNAIQVRETLRCTIVVRVAYYSVVVPWFALTHHERATGDRWVQIIGRGQDLVRGDTAEMVRWHYSFKAIRQHW